MSLETNRASLSFYFQKCSLFILECLAYDSGHTFVSKLQNKRIDVVGDLLITLICHSQMEQHVGVDAELLCGRSKQWFY